MKNKIKLFVIKNMKIFLITLFSMFIINVLFATSINMLFLDVLSKDLFELYLINSVLGLLIYISCRSLINISIDLFRTQKLSKELRTNSRICNSTIWSIKLVSIVYSIFFILGIFGIYIYLKVDNKLFIYLFSMVVISLFTLLQLYLLNLMHGYINKVLDFYKVLSVSIKTNLIHIVAIEGLNTSGKETYSKRLHNSLSESEWGTANVEILKVHFPRYETALGKKIKYILKTGSGMDMLNQTFEKDRENYFDEIYKKFLTDIIMNYNIKNYRYKHYLVVCNRYVYSNYLYGDLSKYENDRNDEELLCRIKEELEVIPKPDIILLFNVTDDKNKALYKNILANDQSKNQNEEWEIQEYITERIKKGLKDNIFESRFKTRVVPVGYTFDENNINELTKKIYDIEFNSVNLFDSSIYL